MMKRIELSALALFAFTIVGVSTAAAADKIDAVEKAIVEKWDKMKSFSADVEISGAVTGAQTTGSLEFARKGDKNLFRMEFKMASPPGGGEPMTMTSISDGEFTYSVTGQMAMKMKTDTSKSMDPKSTFANLRKSNELKLLPDESVDGNAVFVMEAVPNASTGRTGKTVSYFAKDTGVVLKTVSYDAAGKIISAMTLKNLKINPKIDPGRFVFKAPPGVQVMDMTKQ